jgi:hypothetical protein
VRVKLLLESTLTQAIIRALRSVPGIVVRKRHGSALGYAGEPDLYGCFRGRHFEIEVKRPGDRPTALQQARLKKWAATGALAGVAHSVEDALRIVGAKQDDHDRAR